MRREEKRKRRKMLWLDKSCVMISIHRWDEMRDWSPKRSHAKTKYKGKSQNVAVYCHVHNLSCEEWARDFAWIIISSRFCFQWQCYGVGKVKMSTVTTETKWIWRCIPKMKFHFMNEFANATDKTALFLLFSVASSKLFPLYAHI